jgi:uncharacterized protein
MRERFASELKAAMKASDKRRVDTIRLIMAALKDREIEARGQGKTLSGEDILLLLQKLIKSRKESQEIYEKAGRLELASQEAGEISVISSFLPQQLSESEVEAAIAAAIEKTGASSVTDMGKVVGVLKGEYAGRMDFAKASARVKAILSA